MLPARNRLRRRRDFQQLFRGGRVVRGKMMIIRAIPVKSGALVGFVVSSSIFKNATDRNKLRRQLREIVRKIGAPANLHILISVTTQARHREFSVLQQEVESIFQHLVRQSPRR